MPTITIYLDEETDARLKRRLARNGETLSEFICHAVTVHLDANPRLNTRLEALVGTLSKVSGPDDTDLSTSYKAVLRQWLGAKHRR